MSQQPKEHKAEREAARDELREEGYYFLRLAALRLAECCEALFKAQELLDPQFDGDPELEPRDIEGLAIRILDCRPASATGETIAPNRADIADFTGDISDDDLYETLQIAKKRHEKQVARWDKRLARLRQVAVPPNSKPS